MRLGTRGINGTITLHSEALRWTTTSAAVPYHDKTLHENGDLEASLRTRGQGTVGGQQTVLGREGEPPSGASSLWMDSDRWEARGSATATLSAGRVFDLAVVAREEGDGVQTGTKYKGGSVRGDQGSVNVSAGTVQVEVSAHALANHCCGGRAVTVPKLPFC